MRKKQPYLFILIAFIMIMTGIPTSASGTEDYTWSEWSTNKPGGYDYESKIQYRYADKQFIKSGYPSVSGYTRSSKNLISTTYSNWTSNKLSGSTSQNSSYTTEKTVETKSAYWSYAYVCDCMKFFWCNDKGAHKHSDGKKHYTANRLNIYSSKSLSASGHPGEWQDGVYGYKCAQNYYRGSTHKIGYVYCLSYKGKFVDQYSSKTWTWLWQANQKKTVYRTVTKKYDYTHWKWGSYSNWSDSYVASNSNRNVQTRTLYRYKIYLADQDISLSNDANEIFMTYGDETFNLGAQARTPLSYESSAPDVVSVDADGNVSALRSGEAEIIIRARKNDYYKAAERSLYIYVNKAGQKIKTSKNKYNKTYGCSSFSLGAKAKTKITYKSSNKNIATVSSSGKVTVKNPGNAKITLKAVSNKCYESDSKTVKVNVSLKKPAIKVKSIGGGKASLKITTKTPGVERYEIWMLYLDNNNYKKMGTFKKRGEIQRLLPGETYKCKVRAYRTVGGKKVYSPFSAVKSIKIK